MRAETRLECLEAFHVIAFVGAGRFVPRRNAWDRFLKEFPSRLGIRQQIVSECGPSDEIAHHLVHPSILPNRNPVETEHTSHVANFIGCLVDVE